MHLPFNIRLEIAAYEVQNRELGANTDLLERKTKIAPQCPWCKITKVGGFNAIICSVWPGHNALEHHTKHLGSNEDEWRGIDLAIEVVYTVPLFLAIFVIGVYERDW